MESLVCRSRQFHRHPNQHTEAELKLIRDIHRRNPTLGLSEFWYRLKKKGYTRRPEGLFRVMRKFGMFPREEQKQPYTSKPYEQMAYPGQRVQVDVKVVPRVHLIAVPGMDSNVFGWVNAAMIGGAQPTKPVESVVVAPTEATTAAFAKGDKVTVKDGARTYGGESLAKYVYRNTYTVIQVRQDRVVIGIDGVATATMRTEDLMLAN